MTITGAGPADRVHPGRVQPAPGDCEHGRTGTDPSDAGLPVPGPAEPGPVSLTAGPRRWAAWWIIGLSAALLGSVVLCVGIGPAPIAPSTVAGAIAHQLGLPVTPTWTDAEQAIVWTMRAPRVLLGVAVGAGLALCGAALQAMVRNVLADPYILGISGGASTGAAGAILFGLGAGAGQHALPLSAFLGALGASLLVFVISRANGQVTSLRLLLAGVAVGYALSATTSFLIFASDDVEGSRTVMFWLLGSLSLARWDPFLLLVLVLVAGSAGLLMLWSRRLDVLAHGDETARSLGVRPNHARIQVLTVVSLSTGAMVAAAGAIGFVGLVVPHLGRRLVGAAHARLLPVVGLLGAVLLIWADALSRVLMQPRELPIGIVTALVGAPFLLLLIRRMHAQNS
ncbi:FecCD family ABC transporter permease [Nesterenkonia xinjiangensis]|uniref:Iron complex transport system permease protein n=1 Tax=Nesterenkonia xinjiangensis TaxID=225327 RepID=A0A7Z0K832_9MICC|nr:iron ABC transporter permease [Nesterenkonia xinjiangensis]NYJ77226.1 iron complex transport system permease protein [Nesterenkonia xinjiangensis]